MAPRVTLNKINEAILDLGYELVKGVGYFHFSPVDFPAHVDLFDSMVCTCHLSSNTVEEWREILIDKIEETT